MKRYEIRSWVCDWGVWDNVENTFVGVPFGSHYQAVLYLELLEVRMQEVKEFDQRRFVSKICGQFYGIYDTELNEFVGGHFLDYWECIKVLSWLRSAYSDIFRSCMGLSKESVQSEKF